MLPAILNVGGMVAAPFFDGDGSTLTGNIITEYLKVSISGVTENIYPTTNISKMPAVACVSRPARFSHGEHAAKFW